MLWRIHMINDDELNVNTLNEKLVTALEYRNTMKTFNLNKENIKAKVQNLLTYNLNGGTFYIDQNLIGFVNYIVTSGKTESVVLDKNNLPIMIVDTATFLSKISDIYFSAMNEYYADYEKLRSSRKIELALEI